MDETEKLDALFATDLRYLLVTSYVVLCNNAVSGRFIETTFGIPVHAWSALLAISVFPGIKAKEIRKLFPRPQNTISRAISLLEKRGLVRQSASREDGREKAIFATRKGEALLKKIREVSFDRQAEIFAPLDEEELETFFRLALKIAKGPALVDSSVMVQR